MRQIFDLNNDWRFRIIEEQVQGSMSHAQAYQFSQAGAAGGYASINADDSDWETVQLPHDYMVKTGFFEHEVRNHGYRVPHKAWYRKRFFLPASCKGKHLLLDFGGIAMQAKVYFNGSMLQRSFSAYTPVIIDLTDRAFFGDRQVNTLAVEVDGYALEGWFYEGNGIYRDVTLTVKELLHLEKDGCFFRPIYANGNWKAAFRAEIGNSTYESDARDLRLAVRLWDRDQLLQDATVYGGGCAASGSTILSGEMEVEQPKLWSPDAPNLYEAEFLLYEGDRLTDSERVPVGFRRFEATADRGFFLNGEPIKLKGSCNHQDHAGVGVAMPDELIYERVRKLKAIGCNCYRNAHNMAPKALLRACDELGMLLIDETRHFEATDEALWGLAQMVRTARNHPSVILYSMFNEESFQATEMGVRILRRMKALCKKEDGSRMITAALGGGWLDKNGTALQLDVTGINYTLWAAEAFHRLNPDQPVFGSENCSTLATRGCYTSGENQCTNYDEDVVAWGQTVRETLAFMKTHDWYGGVNLWTGFDYRGEPSPYDWPSVSSFFGFYDLCGFEKDHAYLVKAGFTDTPVLHLLPHWNHASNETVRVMAYTNCEQVELFLNGQSLGKQDCREMLSCEWQVQFAAGELSAVGFRDGKAAAWDKRVTAGKAARITAIPHKDSIGDDGRDCVLVALQVEDPNGVLLPCATDTIRLSVEGGVLMGVGNGDPNAHDSETDSQVRLFAGRAQAIIGSMRGGGDVVVRASCKGLEDTVVVLRGQHVDALPQLRSESVRMVHCIQGSGKSYPERLSSDLVTADYDMNSFEWMVFDDTGYKPYFTSGWVLYHIPIVAPRALASETVRVLFPEIKGARVMAEAKGVLIYDQPHDCGPVVLELDAKPGEGQFLTLWVQGNDSESGIKYGIMILD